MSFSGRAQKEQIRGQQLPSAESPLVCDFAVAEQMRLQSSVHPAEPFYLLGMGVFGQESLGH